MSDGIFQIDAVVNAEGVETGVQKARRSIKSLGDEAKKAGTEGARSTQEIGRAGEQSATKLDTATKRMISTIERQTAAIGKTKSEYYESMAALRGLDQQALQPYIQRLREAESAQLSKTNALSNMRSQLSRITPLLGALGVSLSAAGFVSFVAGTAHAADALAKLSQKTGVAVEDLSRLQYAAELSGVSQNQLNTAMEQLARRATTNGEAFRRYGIEVRNVDGTMRSTRELMDDVADVFSKHADGAEKTAAAYELFGRAGTDLIPLLNAGASGLKDMGDESDRLGRTMSGDMARAAEQFNDNMTRIRESARGVGLTIANVVIPRLADLTDEMFRAVQQGETLFGVLERIARGGVVGNRSTLEATAKDIERLSTELAELDRQIEYYTRHGQEAPDRMLFDRGRVSADLADSMKAYNDFAAALTNVGEAADIVRPSLRGVSDDIGGTAPPAGRAAGEMRNLARESERQANVMSQWAASQAAAFAQQETAATRATERMREQLEVLGMSAGQLAEYRTAKLETASATEAHAAAELEAAAAILAARGELPEVARAYRQMAQERRSMSEELQRQAGLTLDLAAAQAELDRQRAAADTARQAEAEWLRTAEEIERSLTDALMRGFESGQGFAENFRDTVRNMINTLVLRPVVQAIVQPVAGSITGMLSGGAGAAGGGMPGIPGMGMTGGLLGSGLLSAGASLGAGTAMGGLATGIGTALSSGAGVFGTMQAGASLIGTAGGTATGIGMIAGAALPIVGGLLAAASLFGGQNTPTNYWQGTTIDTRSGSVLEAQRNTESRRWSPENASASELLAQQAVGLSAMLQQVTGQSYLDTARFVVGNRDKYVGIDGSNEAAARAWAERGGEVRSDGRLLKASIQDAWSVFESVVLDRAMGDLPESMRSVAESMRDSGESITEVLGWMFDDFSLFDSEVESRGKAFERAQRQLAAQFGELGLDVPSSVADFRSLADGIDLTTTSGRELYRALADLAPGFAEVAMAVQAVFDSISRTTAQSIRDIELSVLDNRGKYEYLDREIVGLIESARAATDPFEIQRLFDETNQRMMQAWSLLDSSAQGRLAGEFIDRLYSLEAEFQSQLSVSPPAMDTAPPAAGAVSGADAVAAAVERAIEAAMKDVAAQFGSAGADQAQAAAAMESAANALAQAVRDIPGRMVVTIPDSREVAY